MEVEVEYSSTGTFLLVPTSSRHRTKSTIIQVVELTAAHQVLRSIGEVRLIGHLQCRVYYREDDGILVV
jgi:hypothetical protein